MNAPKVTAEDDIDFLVATPRVASAMEAARCQPGKDRASSHDAFTRLLRRLEPDAETLWGEVQSQVRRDTGFLVLDDSVLDKFYSWNMELVHRVWSGKHKRPVKGIDLMTMLWTDGDRQLPCDYRLYDKPRDGKSKSDHFRDLLAAAKARGFRPRCVVFDSWYTSVENLKQIARFDWKWLAPLKFNRREYHRGLKQGTPIERCQARSARSQRNHIGLSLRAFVRLEHYCFYSGISGFHAKLDLARDAVRAYLKSPPRRLQPSTA